MRGLWGCGVHFPRAQRTIRGGRGMQRSLWPIGLFFVVGFASFEGCVIPINPPTETGDDGGTIGDGGPTTDARLPDGAPIGDDGGDAAPPGAWTSATANLAGLPSE